jgi:hypothetical protein
MERTLDGKDLHHQLSGKRHMQGRMNEAERFGRWSRIAPAFPAGVGSYFWSEEELVDSHVFSRLDTWNKATYGKLVSQSAPAIMARNMPLPEVDMEGDAPYVMATKYPNGPVCVATEGRVSPENQWYYPKSKVTIQHEDVSQPIGVFGYYDALILDLNMKAEEIQHIWAQDLLAEAAVSIMDDIEIKGNKVIIPGKLIEEIGTSAGDQGDISAPGMVLKIVPKK